LKVTEKCLKIIQKPKTNTAPKAREVTRKYLKGYQQRLGECKRTRKSKAKKDENSKQSK